jgi:DHA1 family multidrug resistance protein-like MFS transporter
MLSRLNQTYAGLFREYPVLLRIAVVTGAGQVAFALLNVYALPVYLVQDLHVSGLALGAASATFLLCETVLKFPMGRLSDRHGRRRFVVLGPLLIGLNPILVVALPARLWALVFPIRAADGVGAAALWPPLFAMVGDVVRDRSRAAAMSILNTVYVAATGAAAALGSFVAYLTHSDRSPFYLASVLLLMSAATAHFGLPRSPRFPGEPERYAPAANEPSAADPAGPAPPRLGLVLLISLLMSSGVLMLANFIILYIKLDLGLPTSHIGPLLAALAVPVVVLGLPMGHVADRWGTALAVRVSLAGSALFMWLIPSCHSVTTFGIAAVALVTSHILGTPAWLALISQMAPTSRRGGVMGIVATAEGVGAVLGPVLGGWLWDIRHPYIFYGSAALLSIGAVVAAFALRGGKTAAAA